MRVWTGRQRSRWWRGSAALGGVLLLGAVTLGAFVPQAVRADDTFREQAVRVEAQVVDTSCSSRCNRVRYTVDGTTYTVERGGWDRPLGDLFTVHVDPADPEHFEIGSSTGRALWLATGSMLLLVLGAGCLSMAIGNRPLVRQDGLIRLPAALTGRAADLMLAAIAGQVVGLGSAALLAGSGWSSVLIATGSTLLCGALALLVLSTRPSAVELREDRIVSTGRRRSPAVDLGPTTTWRELRRRGGQASGHWPLRVDDGQRVLRITPHRWGADPSLTRRVVIDHLRGHGSREQAARVP
ncbi:hypothetical protein ASE01_11750 [Nocardioides sp. Root190]|uniref:DUF3592 domain-containing protein n=1 Tax=Nocardioides sp. Root190 TaxID=1736488 RepID=UPI0006F81464|nr:DUF3592 domain-containing protein [Nocardioides sp. Root190]KRB77386.1 hypothetical protein ASE01_11750 [Nocardioides sp. Root190]